MIKKVYYIVVAIVVLALVYSIIKFFPTISYNFSKEFQSSISDSGFSSERRFSFKSTPERESLVAAIIQLNTNFLKESPLKSTPTKTIKGFYKLEHFFTDYEYYYTIKQKMYKMIFDELPILSSNVVGLSNNEIEQYFNNHKNYLSNNFEISDLDNFKDIVETLKPLKDSAIISYELENSYFLMAKQKTLNIRIVFNLENSDKVYLAFQIKMQDDNDFLILPQIKVFGTTSGGMS
jgi:hypothetical protein